MASLWSSFCGASHWGRSQSQNTLKEFPIRPGNVFGAFRWHGMKERCSGCHNLVPPDQRSAHGQKKTSGWSLPLAQFSFTIECDPPSPCTKIGLCIWTIYLTLTSFKVQLHYSFMGKFWCNSTLQAHACAVCEYSGSAWEDTFPIYSPPKWQDMTMPSGKTPLQYKTTAQVKCIEG